MVMFMGLVIQFQRRAIERVMHQETLRLDKNQRYHLGESEIYLYGISEGVGTCSDERYHGIDIAVFGKLKPDGAERDLPRSCYGAVLLRMPYKDEKGISFIGKVTNTTCAVEGLKVVQRNGDGYRFSSNGKTELYTDI